MARGEENGSADQEVGDTVPMESGEICATRVPQKVIQVKTRHFRAFYPVKIAVSREYALATLAIEWFCNLL